jgi:hypothetical protein
VLYVQTAARTSPSYDRWQWRFVGTDSAHRTVRCPMGPCRRSLPIVAIGAQLDAKIPFDSASLMNGTEREDRGWITYDSTSNHLTLIFGPLAFDKPGPIYSFTHVSDTAFSGRWIDGGLTGPMLRYGDVEAWERPEGYFCAHRIR